MTDLLAEIAACAAAHHAKYGHPLITLTYAQSLDGSITAKAGTQLDISGPETKLLTHSLRTVHDAILIGIGTVLADDPKLTARRAGGPNPQPVILDSRARFPLTAQLLQHPTHRPWIVTHENASRDAIRALTAKGARVLTSASSPAGQIDLPSLLARLGAEGIRSIMVEGGAQVITSFLGSSLVDLVVLTIAPIFVGGVRGVDELGLTENFPRLRTTGVTQLGNDLVVWGALKAK